MNNLKKNKQGYGYKYTDLSAIHNHLEENNLRYYQFIQRIEGDDYVMTQKQILNADKWVNDGEPLQGCRVVQATLTGKSNPAQEQGSALTYARRYSLLMAYGFATEDDDAEKLTKTYITKTEENALRSGIQNRKMANDEVARVLGNYGYKKLSEILMDDFQDIRKDLFGEE